MFADSSGALHSTGNPLLTEAEGKDEAGSSSKRGSRYGSRKLGDENPSDMSVLCASADEVSRTAPSETVRDGLTLGLLR